MRGGRPLPAPHLQVVCSQKLTILPHYTCTVSVIAFTPPMCVVPEAHTLTQRTVLRKSL